MFGAKINKISHFHLTSVLFIGMNVIFVDFIDVQTPAITHNLNKARQITVVNTLLSQIRPACYMDTNGIKSGSFLKMIFFLSIYPTSPSREDYVQLCVSKKSMIEESKNDFSKDKKYVSVSIRKK